MKRQAFEELVKEGIYQIPEKVQKLLDNVEIVIEEWPTREELKKVGLSNKYSLFGLYQGVPKTKRGVYYANVLPDKIIIFQGPIERTARSPKEIREIVKRTVWHEIAHHFGLDEKRVKEIEKRKFKKI
jgi:predicted Zn-dependent protease with MMP-like domain